MVSSRAGPAPPLSAGNRAGDPHGANRPGQDTRAYSLMGFFKNEVEALGGRAS